MEKLQTDKSRYPAFDSIERVIQNVWLADDSDDSEVIIATLEIAKKNKQPITTFLMPLRENNDSWYFIIKDIRNWEDTLGINITRAIKIIVMVEKKSPKIITAFHNGADGCLLKPFTAEKLRDEIIRMISITVMSEH